MLKCLCACHLKPIVISTLLFASINKKTLFTLAFNTLFITLKANDVQSIRNNRGKAILSDMEAKNLIRGANLMLEAKLTKEYVLSSDLME